MVGDGDPEIEMTVLGTENNAVVVEQDGLITLEKEHQQMADVIERYPLGNSSAGIAVVNLANCIVGAGVICMPLALLQVCIVLRKNARSEPLFRAESCTINLHRYPRLFLLNTHRT